MILIYFTLECPDALQHTPRSCLPTTARPTTRRRRRSRPRPSAPSSTVRRRVEALRDIAKCHVENTTGKKFAPKAARRRPAPPPTPSAASTEPSVAPTAAQEPPSRVAPVAAPSTVLAVPAAAPQQTADIREEEEVPQSVQQEQEGPLPTVPQSEEHAPQPVLLQQDDNPQRVPQEEAATHHEPTEQTLVDAQVPATQAVEPVADSTVTQPDGEDAVIPQPPRRRRLPWVAVNDPQTNDEAAPAPGPAKRAGQSAKSRGTKDTTAGGAEQDDIGDEDNAQPAGKRLSAKARGKRKATIATAEDDADAQPPPKRTRRPRKAKGKVTAETDEAAEDNVELEADGGEDIATRRKITRKKKQATEGDGETTQPKRKGRPPRAATPSDAEDAIVDPEITFMDGLASRNIRSGKLSSREKQMREIDWAAVRQRRRDEDSRPIPSRAEQEAADKALAETGAGLGASQEGRSQIRLVDGVIQMVQNSGTVNREADAEREIADYEVIEDQDITSHITTRSFMKHNKRFPNEFLLPGQGRRWNADLTDLFYQGLRSFGTDFQMISHMFPGYTRRAIKTKFNREERENPERVTEALQGRSELSSHWNQFLQASQLDEANFADTEKIRQEMAEHEADMREQIKAADLETKQRNEQRRLAGALDDDEDAETQGSEKNKAKKKKKGKEKEKAALVPEEGVEILEYLDE